MRKLARGEEASVFEFLDRQPLKNVQMVGLIRDHGLEHINNRGTFYGCFGDGGLVGVALIGYLTLLSGNHQAIVAFARQASLHHSSEIKRLLGEESDASTFDRILARSFKSPCGSRAESQLLFSINEALSDAQRVRGLRLATEHDADEVTRVHAEACLEQHGVNPLRLDPENFHRRVLERIKLGRVWIIRRGGGITFKADVAAETERAVYLEGVWTRPSLRGRGIGSSALEDVCQRLLTRYESVCLLADAMEQRLASFYRRAGFETQASFRFIRYGH